MPIRIRVARWRSAAATTATSGATPYSEKWCSAIQTASKPSASAYAAWSIASFSAARDPCQGGCRGRTSSALDEAHERGLRERVEVQVEPDDCRRGVRRDGQRVERDGVDGEEVAVRVVPFGRARPAESRLAEVSPDLERAGRQLATR